MLLGLAGGGRPPRLHDTASRERIAKCSEMKYISMMARVPARRPARARRQSAPVRAAGAAAFLAALGRDLRARREAQGKSRAALAQQAGLSVRFLAAVEAGGGNLSVLRLEALRRALGLDWDEVFVPDAAAPSGEREVLLQRLGAFLAARSEAELEQAQAWLRGRFTSGEGPLVALLGLRGAGKTSVGRRLARLLGVGFYELDDLVESAAGLRLEQIFELQGQARYRELEHEALGRFLRAHRSGVLATGGGIVTAPETYALLRQRCLTIWLRARPEAHWERVVRQGDRRPMQGNPAAMQELRALLAAREPLYALAQWSCDTHGRSVAAITRELAAKLGPRPPRRRGTGAPASLRLDPSRS